MRKLIFILTLLIAPEIKAQFIQCVDSVRANPLFQCNDPAYIPVCGCNGITYRNQCVAYNIGGVSNWTSGVCSGIDLDLFPNPIGANSELSINLSFPEFIYGNVTLQIVDLYGKIHEQRFINNFNRISIQIDVRPMMSGIYFLIIRASNGASAIRMYSKA
ncbi:MAG: T9SS type A sorting domain-containing protein [Bacteroidia bacterium]|nr:T9SS type A sorting domain-containing protein [Bacteroidia bacterium]